MLFSGKEKSVQDDATKSLVDALMKAQAVIWFDVDGKILKANENFLATVGYKEEEIVGKHHKMFVSEEYAASDEYRRFWQERKSGKIDSGEYARYGKDGREIWLEASYNPMLDEKGAVVGVVKFAIDITKEKMNTLDAAGQLDAIGRSQAVIEFDLDGIIQKANQNFCDALGYSESEIVGQHHRMFVQDEEANSSGYRDFWEGLRTGTFAGGEFPRVRKNGQTIWIQATYNPIMDASGKPYKVVKYATDITARKQFSNALEEGLMRMSGGDVSVQLETASGSEFESICKAFNETMSRLSEMMDAIQTSTTQVSQGTNKIASGARDLARRTEAQAASLEETNAAIEDISGNIGSTADSAKAANKAAQDAEERATHGESVVQSAISAMERIEGGSRQITEIISVIESIAFQTNLLALNAAVEAARAGESGKGFAVVASEVRTLAQRSSEAAADITQLIESSSSQVSEGANLVRSTGGVLDEIKASVEKVVSNVNEITKASSEQAHAIQEISSVVSGIDANTQDNAQLAQTSSSDANKLAEESDRLKELAAFFGSDKASSQMAEDMLFAKSA